MNFLYNLYIKFKYFISDLFNLEIDVDSLGPDFDECEGGTD